MVKVIVAGSRNFWDVRYVFNVLDNTNFDITELVHGGCRGVDIMADTWAKTKKIKRKEFPADWKKYGNHAGPIRNGKMAMYADKLILIWNGISRGSADMKRQAQLRNLEIEEHVYGA